MQIIDPAKIKGVFVHQSNNRWLCSWLSVFLVAAFISAPGSVLRATADPAEDQKRVSGQIEQTKEDLEETSATLAAAYQKLTSAKAALVAAQEVLATAQSQLATAKAEELSISQKLVVAQASEQKAVEDLASTKASTATATEQVGGIARQAYQSGGVGELAVAFSAQSADDFAERVASIDQAFAVQGRILSDLNMQRAETTAKGLRLSAVRQEIALLRAQAVANVSRRQVLTENAATAAATVAGLVTAQQQAVVGLEQRKVAEQQQLAGLNAQQVQIQAQLRALAARERAEQAARERRAKAAAAAKSSGGSSSDSGTSGGSSDSGGSSGSSGGYLSMPVPGARVTSEFGYRYHPIWHTRRLHTGMDLGIGCGTPVRAAASGSIFSAGWNNAYGNRIMIAHGQVRGHSLVTTYNHLTSISRASGSVSRGEIIGYSGTTGWSTGCHLHFETYQDGAPVNPRNWL